MLSDAIHLPDRLPPRRRGEDSSDDDDDEDFGARVRSKSSNDPSDRMRSAATGVNARSAKNIRNTRRVDDEDEFEFDI